MIKPKSFVFVFVFVFLTYLFIAAFAQTAQETPVTEATGGENFVNSIGMEFKTISAGDFFMGHCKLSDKQIEFLNQFAISCSHGTTNSLLEIYDKPHRKVMERPPQQVFITKDFQISIHEVTIEQFMQYAITRRDLITDNFIRYNNTSGQAPITGVSWNDVQDFVDWLNRKEGGNLYRLPTEAEWEYAARAGTTTRYSWGDDPSKTRNHAWFAGNVFFLGDTFPKPVGQKEPNPFGLYDMSGNVWEWVQDWFGVDYGRNLLKPINNPQGPQYGSIRVIRGGGWQTPEKYLQPATRSAADPNIRTSVVGFRLVRMLEQNEITFNFDVGN